MPDAPSTSDGNPPMQEQLDQYRDYLRFLADVKLDRRLRGRIDASDIVQETMVKACAAWDQCTGEAAGQRVAWLRQILMRTILHAVRDERRAKRDVGREQRLDRALDESTRRIECFLAADQTSPSVSLQQAEELKQVADAVYQLPEAERRAIVGFYWQRSTLREVAEDLGRTPAAAAGLVRRGLERLRGKLAPPSKLWPRAALGETEAYRKPE